jgi:hypothetical protein
MLAPQSNRLAIPAHVMELLRIENAGKRFGDFAAVD